MLSKGHFGLALFVMSLISLPLWPISQREVTWGWFYADSKTANNVFFYLGIGAFLIYIMVSSVEIEPFILAYEQIYEEITKLFG